MKPTKGKKFAKIVKGKKISYGATGYKIKPGTKAGDSYCARSLGIEKANKAKGKGVTANTLSRRKWGCVKDKSMK
jgi:hypothetical protein